MSVSDGLRKDLPARKGLPPHRLPPEVLGHAERVVQVVDGEAVGGESARTPEWHARCQLQLMKTSRETES